MFTWLQREGRYRISAVKRLLGRVTPLTWFIWVAMVSDFCAPGYLVFHVGITTVDAGLVAEEVLALWKVATNAPDD